MSKKVPQIFQLEGVECAAASLAMVLGYYGRWETLQTMRLVLGVSRDGAKASRIVSAAQQFGLKPTPLRVSSLEQLKNLSFPGIAFWNANHFIVVEGYKSGKFIVKDPAAGPRKIKEQDFMKSFSGVYIGFETTSAFKPGGIKPNPLLKIYERIKGEEKVIIAAAILGLVGVIPGVFIAVVSGEFVEQVFVHEKSNWVNPMLWMIGVSAVFSYLVTLIRQNIVRDLQKKLEIKYSYQFLSRLLTLPLTFFRQRRVGDTVTRIDESDNIAISVTQELGQAMSDLASVIVFGAVMLSMNSLLFILFLATVMINFVVVGKISGSLGDMEASTMRSNSFALASGYTALLSIDSLKASNSENGWYAKWSGYFAKFINDSQKLSVLNYTLSLTSGVVETLQELIVIIGGVVSIINGWMTLGEWVSFTFLRDYFLGPLNGLVGFTSSLPGLNATIRRLDDVLQYPLPEDDALRTIDKGIISKLSGQISFEDVEFKYSTYDKPLISNLTFNVNPGEYVAIVGNPGSGSSTLIGLINGLYQPTSGLIKYDSHNIRDLSKVSIEGSISNALQSTTIFNNTLKYNLVGPYSSMSSSEIYERLKITKCEKLIYDNPLGLERILQQNGGDISGGEAQLLEVTRCLMTNPTILTLDQATSNLDLPFQCDLINNLISLNITIIHSSRSNALLSKTDKIIFLKGNGDWEYGTHTNFLSNDEYKSILIV
jgi:ABC-type bacteriocin/lantibiotic exporter with double-glycine peptidase domain